MEASSKLSTVQIWWIAIRPKTLPAAAAPVIAATALAYRHNGFRFGPAIACLATALLLQIAANLANDMFDFQRGTDTLERLGPLRVTQSGLLTPSEVKQGMWVCFGLAALLGIYVAISSNWSILLIGVAAILAALAYSGGPLPYGYYGLGEVGVFLFFGFAAVCGTYFGQVVRIEIDVILLSIAMGCLSTAILVVNNLRDIQTDRSGGKKTLAVLLGAGFTRWHYIFLIMAAYTIPLVLWYTGQISLMGFLVYTSVPLAARACSRVFRLNGRELNLLLAETGRLELVFAVLFSLGLIIG